MLKNMSRHPVRGAVRSVFALAEYGGADAHHCGAAADGQGIVVAHAHADGVERLSGNERYGADVAECRVYGFEVGADAVGVVGI